MGLPVVPTALVQSLQVLAGVVLINSPVVVDPVRVSWLSTP
jgi:hypothetical protein